MKDFKTTYGVLVTGDWPVTVPKNASGPSASDGTPFTADLIADLWGWQKRIMVLAGMTPDGSADSDTASQIVTAIERAIRGPGELALSCLNAAALAVRRLLPMNGQVVPIASYQRLCDAVYVGDTDNATAHGFYKTSDSGGVTRSTSGTYMVMPDCRGLFIRGLGVSAVRQAANGTYFTGGTIMANFLNDMMQGHRMGPLAGSNFLMAGATGYGIMGAGTTARNDATTGNPVTDTVNGTPRAGYENRPASVSAQICITY